MYSGGWAFSNSRKSVKYPPHDPHTSGSTKAPYFRAVLFGILQKPNKSQSSQKRTKAGIHAGIRPEPEPAASRRSFLPVFRPCFIPLIQSLYIAACACVLSRPHSRSAASTRQHTTPARAYINRYNKALPIL